jgi:membrane-bound serine protease (ClpP class)
MSSVCYATSDKPIVYQIDIKKEINKTTQIYLSKGLSDARMKGASAVLLHLNTYGGILDAADSMRTAILYSSVPVYVFIDNNAASAGALLSIACKSIYMRRGASIGAATVVNQTGAAMPDKYQSYMRAMMRSTAEAHGRDTVIHGNDTTYRWFRDPQIAEAMVDERIYIANLIDTGKTLTLTAEEALKWDYCEGLAETTDEVITKYLGYTDYELLSYEPTWLDELKGFLMSPVLQSVLIMLIIGGIYFELQTPGMGFPSVAALIAAVLYFAPLYIDGMAANWEILIFILGLILVVIELFAFPGFGFIGIIGTLLVIVGLTLALLDNVNFNFDFVSDAQIGRSIMTVLIGLTVGFSGMLWLSSRLGSAGVFRRAALIADLETSVTSSGMVSLTGKEGVAATVLRPSGKVIIDGVYYDAASESGFIERGTRVVVVRYENSQVYVEVIV